MDMRLLTMQYKSYDKKLNIVVLFTYSILLLFVIYFHEPWYDEAQSWLIARDASYYDMLFYIPHYEGHPPFWWLLLSIPAKLGLPYELSLKSIQFLFSSIATYLIVFKSPFPSKIRLLLPFTYFPFYQYGVQARPYSIMLCILCSCAITWKHRNKKPLRFCLTLMLLCLTSAYGIILSCGIAISWTFEALLDKTLFKNRCRFFSLLALLVVGIISIIMLIPAVDSYANDYPSFAKTTRPFIRLLLFVFCFPSEVSFTSYAPDIHIWYYIPSWKQIIVMFLISSLIWGIVIVIGYKRKTIQYFLAPFCIFALFSSFKYFCMHHIGILFMLLIFFFWISWPVNGIVFRNIIVRFFLNCFIMISIIISISWSVYSSYADVKENVSYGRILSDYYMQENLSEYVSAVTWQQERNKNGELIYENTHILHFSSVEANPYLSVPILKGNLNGHSYVDYNEPTQKVIEKEKLILTKKGIDIILGDVNESFILELKLKKENFSPVKFFTCNRVWKNQNVYQGFLLYCTEDVKEKLK